MPFVSIRGMAPRRAEPTYLVRIATLLLDDAVRSGLDREAVLRAVEPGIAASLRDPDARIPLTAFVAIVRAVVAASDPSFGVRAGAARRARDGGLIGYAMLHSATLRDAIGRWARYGRIMGTHNRIDVEDAGARTTIAFQGHPALEAVGALTELSVSWLIAVLREIAGRELSPVEVRLPYAEPVHAAALRAHARCLVGFRAPETALVFRRDDLDRPLPSADATLVGYLDQLAEQAVRTLGSQDTTAGRLRQVLWTRLSGGAPPLRAAAAAMALSPRSLQRRLAGEGTAYDEVLDDLRHELAVSLLQDRGLAVYEIGFLLGYADATAFHRAFRRWRGVSPRRFRDDQST
jgi:AraC-like DNA-binding protein